MASNGAAPAVTGCWQNQLGTRLEVRADEGGAITGWIHSHVGGVAGSHPVVGYVAANPDGRGVIGFAVSWGETRSVTVWSGRYDVGNDVIVANWLLTTADFDENEWQSTRLGHDTFRRTSSEGTDRQDTLTVAAEPAARPPV